jgi:hypothetical protein
MISGTAETGKSTLARQMKFIYGSNSGAIAQSSLIAASRRFTQPELLKYRQIIRKNIIESVHCLMDLVDQVKSLGQRTDIKQLRDLINDRLMQLQVGEGDDEQRAVAFLNSATSGGQDDDSNNSDTNGKAQNDSAGGGSGPGKTMINAILALWKRPQIQEAILLHPHNYIPDSTE